MKLFTPLGLIALIAFLILLLIYLVKPSYQDKMLSSTYVWQRSLKYKKKSLPLNKLKNILQVFLQVSAVSLCIFALCTPMFNSRGDDKSNHDIIILDKNAGMLYEDEAGTRFDKAVNKALEMSKEAIDYNHYVSIITNEQNSKFVVKKSKDFQQVSNTLKNQKCTYSSASIKDSVELANDLIKTNSLADVHLITGTKYENTGDLNVVNIADEKDWNVGILGVKAEQIDNYYEYTVELSSYGADKYVNVNLVVNNTNHTDESEVFNERVNCLSNTKTKVTFKDTEIFLFNSAEVTIEMDDRTKDGFVYDDNFKLFGGITPELKIQYTSTRHNVFFSGALNVLRNQYSNDWNMDIKYFDEVDNTELKGYDFYIFENTVPKNLPKDGFVFLVNPDDDIREYDITVGQPIKSYDENQFSIKENGKSDILSSIVTERIKLTSYKPITFNKPNESQFETLWTIDGNDVFSINDQDKLAILSLDLNRSNLALLPDFPLLITNTFNHFVPKTIQKYVFDVGEDVVINSRGSNVKIDINGESKDINCPETYNFDKPGVYEVSENIGSNINKLQFYVKINNAESNCHRVLNDKNSNLKIIRPDNVMVDGLMYIAITLAVVLGIEKLLASKGSI